MAGLQQLEFFLLRYAGDAIKGESINLGVVAISPEGGEQGGFADVRFIRNWRRLHCFDPLVEIEEMHAIEREIRRDLLDPQRRAEMLTRVGDAYSNNIRVDLLQGCLAESPAQELDTLASFYLETPSATDNRELTGRQRILSVIRDQLREAGVLEFMLTDFSVAEFTKLGDPLRLDFGYQSGNNLKFLHAVSLHQRVESGTILAARFPQIVAGMQAKRGVKAWLTAIADDDLDRGRDEVAFTLEMMRENGIVVARTAEMPQIAEGIRLELLA
jgi:hypothetical protein